MGANVPPVSDAELDVIKVLWVHGPGTVRDIETHLRRRRKKWAYNTIHTLLTRLRDKGCVTADKSGLVHVFSAAISRERLLHDGLMDLADRVCDGTASPLLHALVKSRGLSSDDIAAMRKMLDDLEAHP